MKWVGSWEEILNDIGNKKKTLVIYPYGSIGHYGTKGNIEKLSASANSQA